jgi:DNA (cytosine-5)-methyltransferase 1
MPKKIKPIAVEIFSGVGGMGLGFEQAGFNVVSAFDIEQRNVDTYKRNFQHTKAHVADLSECNGADIRKLSELGERNIDVLFGGPPCQGFSVGGVQDVNDDRNTLVYDFARLVRQLQPTYFVMENVAGLMMAHAKPVLESLVRRLKLAGYSIVTPIKILDASEFGVPQRRRRVFILGYRKSATPIFYPEPKGLSDPKGKEYFPRVKDAISDLPDVELYEELFDEDGLTVPLGKPSYYGQLMRGEIRDSQDRSARRKMPKVLTGCMRTKHSRQSQRRFASTAPGSAEPVSRYVRLSLEGFAPTIRAGTGVDRGSHTSPRPIHPTKPRCITVREAARLHSFPDWFQFHETRWHAFRQIGNSVPPLLARAVANSIIKV